MILTRLTLSSLAYLSLLTVSLILHAEGRHGDRAVLPLQPLAAQTSRLVEALDYIGAPLSAADRHALDTAMREAGADDARTASAIQAVLDRSCLFEVHINPESRVRVTAGAARPDLVQHGWRTFLVKVYNEAGVTAPLVAESAQALPVSSRGLKRWSVAPRPEQTITTRDVADRWLDLELFNKPPMTATLSGLAVEYRIIQLYSRDAGQREATISFSVGQGTQDFGFRADLPVLFKSRASRDITLHVVDDDGRPTTASFVIRDVQGHVYPSPAKRLAPDFPFQPHVYRADGETIALPPGRYKVEFTRGPEYVRQSQMLEVADLADGSRDNTSIQPARYQQPAASSANNSATFRLTRWIDTARMGWYSGDYHVHASGCLHYETPSIGVLPQDIIRHIVGEGLNVGAVLTWGPGYYFQRQFLEGKDNQLSTPEHLLHYDLEISEFPSSHSGHPVLLGLTSFSYPGATVLEDWPTWNLPILQWAKAQGATVGYAHSGAGLEVASTDLPNYEVPKFDGVGADEFLVDLTYDAVDFMSTVDTAPLAELNLWYHVLNAGFRPRIGGETDFPCLFGERVGVGRGYVQVDDALTYARWLTGLRDGRAYVSDGKSHIMDFRVDDQRLGTNGSEIRLDRAANIHMTARVAARLDVQPDTWTYDPIFARMSIAKKPYWDLEQSRIGATREVPVEVIVNGKPVARQTIVADGTLRDLAFDVAIDRSSWVALRILPSSHTNPMFVLVGGRPIRASRASAEWCLAGVNQCWSQKQAKISDRERPAANQAYEHARKVYRQRAAESD